MKKAKSFVTPVGILCFPNVFEARAFDERSKEEYSAILVFPKGTDISLLVAKVKECAAAAGLKSGARNPIHDGNEKVADWGEIFRDAKFIRISSQYQPSVVDASKHDILDKKQVYSGVYARASVHCYSYDSKGNSGVSIGLDAVQIVRDGEPLGGGAAAVALFDEIPEDAAPAADPFGDL